MIDVIALVNADAFSKQGHRQRAIFQFAHAPYFFCSSYVELGTSLD